MQSRNDIGCIWYILAGLIILALAVYGALSEILK